MKPFWIFFAVVFLPWLTGIDLAAAEDFDSRDSVREISSLTNVYSRLGLNGSLRGAYWSDSRRWDGASDLIVGAAWLHAQPTFFDSIKLVGDGWLRDENIFQSGTVRGDLREAYAETSWKAFDFDFGRIMTIWGKADAINPTDNLSPRNYTLLVPEDSDQRSGQLSAKVAYNFDQFRLTGIWLGEFRRNLIPLPPFPAGVTLNQQGPNQTWNQWAAKFEQSGGQVDWSVSYYDGFDHSPDFAIASASPAGVQLVELHHRIQVVGADAATNLGRYAVRAEAAYTFTENQSGTDPQIKNPFFFGVLGSDRTFFESFNINLQYVFRYIVNYQNLQSIADPSLAYLALQNALNNNQYDQIQHGASLRLNQKWLHDVLETEVLGFIWFGHGDWLLRPKAIYAINDHLKVSAGADFYRGPALSFFGRLRPLSTFFTELRLDF